MDNKLSELSKPVAYDYQIAGACIADGNDKKWVDWNNKITHECPPDWMVEDGKATGIKLLYSQEYVSALLAELEFEKQNNAGVAGMVEDYETKLEVKDKRIEALERINQAQDDHINQQQDRIDSLEKTNAGLGQRLDFHRALTDSDIGKDDLEEIKVGLRAALCNVTAPPAPAVPDALANDIDSDDHPLLWSYNNGWNACRAAMLAQPVSSGYTLPDGWKLVPVEPTAEMINAALASGALSIRSAYRLMLAAAPEGGNDHDTRR